VVQAWDRVGYDAKWLRVGGKGFEGMQIMKGRIEE
jgi:hypothetical protein